MNIVEAIKWCSANERFPVTDGNGNFLRVARGNMECLCSNAWIRSQLTVQDILTDWVIPKQVSGMLFCTMPYGTCAMLDSQTCYLKVCNNGIVMCDLETGNHIRFFTPDTHADFKLCIHHGVPCEPLPGTQYHAQLMARIGYKVTDSENDGTYWMFDKGDFQFYTNDHYQRPATSQDRLLVDEARHQTGWRIIPPVKLLTFSEMIKAAHIHEEWRFNDKAMYRLDNYSRLQVLSSEKYSTWILAAITSELVDATTWTKVRKQ